MANNDPGAEAEQRARQDSSAVGPPLGETAEQRRLRELEQLDKDHKPSPAEASKAEAEARQLIADQAQVNVQQGGVALPPEQLKAEQDKAAALVKSKGATSQSAIHDLLNSSLGRVTLAQRLPNDIVEMTHGIPDDATLQKAMTIYNGASHTGANITDPSIFLQQLANHDTQATMALSLTVGGEPISGVNIPLGPAFGGKQMFLSADNQKAWQANWPTAFANVQNVAANASMAGIPTALLGAASEANRAYLTAGSTQAYARRDKGIPTSSWFNASPQRPTDPVGAALGEYDLGQRLQTYVKKYDDFTLALIATRDPNIADKIQTGATLSDQESASVRQLFIDAKYDPTTMAQAGTQIDIRKFGYVNNLVGGDGSIKTPVKLPNSADMQQALQTVYRAWFQEEPNKDQLDAFAAQMNASAAASQRGASSGNNPFQGGTGGQGGTVEEAPSISSAATQFARQDPQYQRLFNQKPVNLDESAYVQQFSNAAQRSFGDQGAGQADAIAQGMQSGDVNQTLGHLAGQANAMDNATFRERLAVAAQAVGRMV